MKTTVYAPVYHSTYKTAGIDNDDDITVKNGLAWFAAEHVARNFEYIIEG